MTPVASRRILEDLGVGAVTVHRPACHHVRGSDTVEVDPDEIDLDVNNCGHCGGAR